MASGASRSRAQTTQDFAVGIGLFLLVVVFVITFLPSVLAPFGQVDDAERSAQAERVAATIVANATVEGERVHLDTEILEETFAALDASEYHLPEHLRVGVELHDLGEDDPGGSFGATYDGGAAGSWVRMITTSTQVDTGSETVDCTDGCRMVVRVW